MGIGMGMWIGCVCGYNCVDVAINGGRVEYMMALCGSMLMAGYTLSYSHSLSHLLTLTLIHTLRLI